MSTSGLWLINRLNGGRQMSTAGKKTQENKVITRWGCKIKAAEEETFAFRDVTFPLSGIYNLETVTNQSNNLSLSSLFFFYNLIQRITIMKRKLFSCFSWLVLYVRICTGTKSWWKNVIFTSCLLKMEVKKQERNVKVKSDWARRHVEREMWEELETMRASVRL